MQEVFSPCTPSFKNCNKGDFYGVGVLCIGSGLRVILSGENRKAVCEVELLRNEKSCVATLRMEQKRERRRVTPPEAGSTKGFQ